MKLPVNKSVVLFDGVCKLCQNAVKFIIKHDTKERFLFASLQSDAAKDILLQSTTENFKGNSIVLFQNNKVYTKSTAALHIAKHLSNGYSLMFGFIVIPKILRDGIYNIIAKHRYNWFGKDRYCMVPSEEIKKRFIE